MSAPSESVPRPHRRRLRRGVRRARLVPRLKPTAGRVTDGMAGRENRHGRDDSDGRTRLSRELAHCPRVRVDRGSTGRRPLPPRDCPTLRTARTDDLQRVTEAAQTEPDPGPCLRRWGLRHRPMILLQQCGAVPKGTAPFYRLITDARFANRLYSDWGVKYTTAAQLSSTLNQCDFHFSIDISDAYHLSLWAGCGGRSSS